MTNANIVSSDFKLAFSSLSPKRPFASFNIKLLSDEIILLENIHISDNHNYDNFGNLDILHSELIHFISSIGNNNIDIAGKIAGLISNIVNNIIHQVNKETAWVTLRATIPTNEWDAPRWHSDGYYYTPYEGDQFKIAISLKGPSTLFYTLPNNLREEFNKLQMNIENRVVINKMLDSSKSIILPKRAGAIFIVGSKYAAVHSEPPTHETRLFLSILPGSEMQIHELYNNWHSSDVKE